MKYYYPEVDDSDAVIGKLKHNQLHKPPYPIHRSTVIFILSPFGEVWFQRRSIALRSLPARLDLVGGHVQGESTYEETAKEELQWEFPIPQVADRIRQVEIDNELFFRVRMNHNNENRGVFITYVTESENTELPEWNRRLRLIWNEILQSVSEKKGRTPESIRSSIHTNVEETYDSNIQKILQNEIKGRLQNASSEEQRLLELAREVEEYIPLSLVEALSEYRSSPELFADGFYALFDDTVNSAPQVSDYTNVILSAIRKQVIAGLAIDKRPLAEGFRKLMKRMGVPGKPTVTLEELRESMVRHGIRPEDNEFSRAIIEERDK